MIVHFFMLICLVNISIQKATPEDEHYVAAVVEYQFAWRTEENLQNYINYIEEAASQNADIIVFPEMTLTMAHPVGVPVYGALKDYPVPAANASLYDQILVILSEAAKEHQIYVVVNIEERMDCSSSESVGELCPEKKVYLFNTNVVFDRSGAIIDRFRKIHLFGEPSRTPALRPELGSFSTDFGVTFGHFICFDLMFQVPAVQLVQKLNVTDVVFTTMWFSETPFLTAVQMQEAYAYVMNVSLLASGVNSIRGGSAGSGIFSGKAGALVSTMPMSPVSRLLVSRVPKVPGDITHIGTFPGPIREPPTEFEGFRMLQEPSLKSHASRLLVPGLQEFELSQNEVDCKFRVRMDWRNYIKHYEYRASVFDGVRTFSGLASGGTRMCAIMSCTNTNINSCGLRFDTYTGKTTAIFEEITIEATVPTPTTDPDVQATDSVYYPITLDIYTMPLRPENYMYHEDRHTDNTVITMSLKNADVNLHTFAVWGRTFVTDGNMPTLRLSNSSNSNMFNALLIVWMGIVCICKVVE